MRLHNQELNNLAVYTGVRYDALKRFIRKYNLDVAKLERNVTRFKNVRKDLAAAVSGYENNDLAQGFAQEYGLDESRRAGEFFTSKHGKTILNQLKRNGKEFNRDVVLQYFDKLNTDDYKWARIMDFIAADLGLNVNAYETFQDQANDMVKTIEILYEAYKAINNGKTVIARKTINEMVDKVVEEEITEYNERASLKRLVIDMTQFEALLNHVLNPHNTRVTITNDDNADSYTFEVNTDKMKMFLDFIKTLPTLRVIQLRKDGNTLYVTVINSGRFIEWVPLVTFYKEQIKI